MLGIPFLDVVKESIECYVLIAKTTSKERRCKDRWDTVALRERNRV